MAQNEVRLQLHVLAYNLGVFLQITDLSEGMADWSLTSLRTQVTKNGARVRPPRPLYYLPIGRGRSERRSVHPHHCCHPSPALAASSCMTVSMKKPERKWLD